MVLLDPYFLKFVSWGPHPQQAWFLLSRSFSATMGSITSRAGRWKSCIHCTREDPIMSIPSECSSRHVACIWILACFDRMPVPPSTSSWLRLCVLSLGPHARVRSFLFHCFRLAFPVLRTCVVACLCLSWVEPVSICAACTPGPTPVPSSPVHGSYDPGRKGRRSPFRPARYCYKKS